MPPDHKINIVMNILRDKFDESSLSDKIKIEIFWGINGLDKEGLS